MGLLYPEQTTSGLKVVRSFKPDIEDTQDKRQETRIWKFPNQFLKGMNGKSRWEELAPLDVTYKC